MTCRIIYSLQLELVPPPDTPPRASCFLIVPLRRDGMPANTATSNGRPRPPKLRTIDLRPGDQVLCDGRWQTIKGISAYRDCWLTEERAAKSDGDGYLYRVTATH